MNKIPINQIIVGDASDILKTLPDNSVDAICCDPPAGINFMGKEWDGSKGGRIQWVAWLSEVMTEALRCLKPGGHAFVWALPKTSHWTACALEDAGFEIREKCYHIFSTGFPKSLDISKAIDRMSGAEREIVSTHKTKDIRRNVAEDMENGWTTRQGKLGTGAPTQYMDYAVTKPSTPEAQQWDGWGTALKPAVEEWILCRKPLTESGVARNVLAWKTGGINIDACRIGDDPRENQGMSSLGVMHDDNWQPKEVTSIVNGRWPAHLLISHAEGCQPGSCVSDCPAMELDLQSGLSKSGGEKTPSMAPSTKNTYGKYNQGSLIGYTDQGGASRFFTQFYYAPKASVAERNLGCEDMPAKQTFDKNTSKQIAHINHATGETTYNDYQPSANQNHHPTVKNQSLMRWLIRLITPPNGIVLDCFAGSGSTGVAVITEGFRFIGIEIDPEYAAIAKARLNHAISEAEAEAAKEKQLPLFDVPATPKPVKPTMLDLWQLDTVAS